MQSFIGVINEANFQEKWQKLTIYNFFCNQNHT